MSVAISNTGSLAKNAYVKFNGVKVFSATMVADRDQLGEKISAWLAAHPQLKVTDMVGRQPWLGVGEVFPVEVESGSRD